MTKIFIDPGHGGSDTGATANGLREKDVCLAIGLKLRDLLQRDYQGIAVKLSRDSDITRTLEERTSMANHWGADYLISVHINAGGGTGFESYIYNDGFRGKDKTNRARAGIHDEITKATNFRDRGKKEANFHMLRESAMPAILTENGFIDHAGDASKLKSDAFLNRIAHGHVNGFARALNLKKKKSVGESTSKKIHTIQKGDTLWRLAKRYNLTVSTLLKLNPGVEPEFLQIGQQLIVGGFMPSHHTIEKGDTLWALARKYDTTVKQLMKLNPGIEPRRLRIGKKLRVT